MMRSRVRVEMKRCYPRDGFVKVSEGYGWWIFLIFLQMVALANEGLKFANSHNSVFSMTKFARRVFVFFKLACEKIPKKLL